MGRTWRLKARAARGAGATLSLEHPLALLVDDLLALGDREGGGLVEAGVGLGADEGMLLHALRKFLLDRARGLIAARRFVGRRPDAEAVVLDGLEARRLRGGAPRCQSPPRQARPDANPPPVSAAQSRCSIDICPASSWCRSSMRLDRAMTRADAAARLLAVA